MVLVSRRITLFMDFIPDRGYQVWRFQIPSDSNSPFDLTLAPQREAANMNIFIKYIAKQLHD